MMTPPVKSGPRYNEMIVSDKVRVIDENGENLGVMYTREAIEQAAGVGLDLVEVSPNADPPVCKFLDVGKFRYEAQKKARLVPVRVGVTDLRIAEILEPRLEGLVVTLGQHLIDDGTPLAVTVRTGAAG